MSNIILDELRGFVEQYQAPFVAYTCSPSCYHQLREETLCEQTSGLANLPFSPFAGLEVWNVQRQIEDCLEWRDKEKMIEYLTLMGEIKQNEQQRTNTSGG